MLNTLKMSSHASADVNIVIIVIIIIIINIVIIVIVITVEVSSVLCYVNALTIRQMLIAPTTYYR